MNHKGTAILETKRLLLRPLEEKDAAQMYENWAFDEEVTKYLTWPPHQSEQASLGFIRFCMEGYKKEDMYQWGIVLKETDMLIGTISVVEIDENADAMELGWVIGRNWWGQGIMPEAAEKVLQFLFEEVGANRIAAKHDTNNPKSGRVMQKVGMSYEGTLRMAGRNNQGIVDIAVYSILKSEYTNK